MVLESGISCFNNFLGSIGNINEKDKTALISAKYCIAWIASATEKNMLRKNPIPQTVVNTGYKTGNIYYGLL